ncbi:hypothetical protein B0T09DRAFT_381179 [Sordaria sp. MPI-SDFR-AT-0083]|nr:hypothetical protein B0T09DRAFT_381179 [Sordaria sp. MPI-SDFR-AT-0083]
MPAAVVVVKLGASTPSLAHDFGFVPGLAQFITSPTYVGVIGAQFVPVPKELMLIVSTEGNLMHTIRTHFRLRDHGAALSRRP